MSVRAFLSSMSPSGESLNLSMVLGAPDPARNLSKGEMPLLAKFQSFHGPCKIFSSWLQAGSSSHEPFWTVKFSCDSEVPDSWPSDPCC